MSWDASRPATAPVSSCWTRIFRCGTPGSTARRRSRASRKRFVRHLRVDPLPSLRAGDDTLSSIQTTSSRLGVQDKAALTPREFAVVLLGNLPAVAPVEAARAMIVAEAFEAFGSENLRLLQKKRTAALPARQRVHEQHVDMAIRHEQESNRLLMRHSHQHMLPGRGEARAKETRVAAGKDLRFQNPFKSRPIGSFRNPCQRRHIIGPCGPHPHGCPLRRGSRVSRRASPRRLKPKERKRMAKPAKIALQGESMRKLRPSDSIKPSDGVGGCVPRPRKESEASTRIAAESRRLVWTRTTEARLGRMCRKMMRPSDAPIALAPATYSLSHRTSAGPRKSLAKIGV